MAKRQSRKPSKVVMLDILESQQCRCAYCNVGLDVVEIEWDHFVPYAWAQSNSNENFVAACKACNRAKMDTYMASEADLRHFCLKMVKEHGSLGEGIPEGITASFLVKRFG